VKNKKIIIAMVFAATLFCLPAAARAQCPVFDRQFQMTAASRALDWQTYEFWVKSNRGQIELCACQWQVDGGEIVRVPRLHYFFAPGRHTVSVTVTDEAGNRRADNLVFEVNFWSMHNNQLLWFAYSFLVLVILYYWAVKLIYLFGRRKLSKATNDFLAILDQHGYVESMVRKIKNKYRKK
jgi:hypothetical protein